MIKNLKGNAGTYPKRVRIELMNEAQIEFIAAFKADLQRNAPDAYAYLCEETLGAATGLEYYGMLSIAVKAAFEHGLISAHYKDQVVSVEKAVRRIYGS